MRLWRELRDLFSVGGEDPELVKAQAGAFTRQMPVLYSFLIANTLALAGTHLSLAPLHLTVLVPAILCIGCLARLIFWIRLARQRPSAERALRILRASVVFAGVLGVGTALWALNLYHYGSGHHQAHVALFMASNGIGCIFCMMHVRAAALSGALAVTIPFVVFFLFQNIVLAAIAVNFAIVMGALILTMLGHDRQFTDLVLSKRQLTQKQLETQSLSDQFFQLANCDSLTGLPNRRQFFTHLEEVLARHREGEPRIIVGRVDLDGFKMVNDVFGHLIGDKVLIDAGARMSRLEGNGVFIARLGGDEFGLVLENFSSRLALDAFGQRLCHALAQPYVYPAVTARVTGSVGFAIARELGDTAEHLHSRADFAAYTAKQTMRGQVVVFSDQHESLILRQRTVEKALQNADLAQEISLVFQPVYDVQHERAIGFEVLARWQSPTLGSVSPGEFIPVAEKIGIVSRVTEAVLAKAIEAVKRLPPPLRLSVNLSASDVASPATVRDILGMLGDHPDAARRLDFEITETAYMRDVEKARDVLLALAALGARISLDDFGTGHSSLAYVRNLPLNTIKIDRSFVSGIASDKASRAIVKTTIELCRNLGLGCILEGVETREQLDALVPLGGTMIQGYLFGKPMTASELYRTAGEPRRLAS